jgi:hypothetical protein
MLESLLTVKLQGPVPAHAAAFPIPALHANPPPTAVSVTESPFTNAFEQVAAQLLIPAGVDETVPLPGPAKFTVTVGREPLRWVSACWTVTVRGKLGGICVSNVVLLKLGSVVGKAAGSCAGS